MGNKGKDKQPESRNKRFLKRAIIYFFLWLILTLLLGSMFTTLDDSSYTGYQRWEGAVEWGIVVSVIVGIYLFNIASADILRHYVKQHGRNVIAWVTSIIVFTPILSGIVYLLTWPKNQKFTGLEG